MLHQFYINYFLMLQALQNSQNNLNTFSIMLFFIIGYILLFIEYLLPH